MMTWYLKFLLKRRKKFALLEVNYDIQFLKSHKKELLFADVGAMRRKMAELNKKSKEAEQGLTEQEEAELSTLVSKIAKAEATKAEYEQIVDLKKGLEEYISMLG